MFMQRYEMWKNEIPEGYITGLSREYRSDERLVAHLYEGTFSDPGNPMCKRGWNRGEGYSIWRNNVGIKGICKICLKRAEKGLSSVELDDKEEDMGIMQINDEWVDDGLDMFIVGK